MTTDTLTKKQALFVQEFLIDMNGTQAALRSGYSERTAKSIAAENLTKPAIIEALQNAMAERAARTELEADDVLRGFMNIANTDLRDVLDWDGKTVTIKSMDDISDAAHAAIAEISETKTKDGSVIRIKMHSKPAALDSLGKHLPGFFSSTTRHEGSVDVNHHRDGQASITQDEARDWFSELSLDELDSILLRFSLQAAIAEGKIVVVDPAIYAEWHITPPAALPAPQTLDATFTEVSDDDNAGESA